MTSVTLHSPPPYRAVVREQLRAVGLALRTEGIFLLGFLGLISVLVITVALRNRAQGWTEINYMLFASLGLLGMVLPLRFAGLLVPFGVWRSEDPSRRSYHWAMPIAHGPHTLTKTLSGWLWMMAAVAIYTVYMIGLMFVVSYIVMGHIHIFHSITVWQILSPFTATTLIYLIISIAVICSDHPWRWIVGIVISYLIALSCFAALDLDNGVQALDSLINGSYGLKRAFFGAMGSISINQVNQTVLLNSLNSPRTYVVIQWIKTASLWIIVSGCGVCLAAYYRRDA